MERRAPSSAATVAVLMRAAIAVGEPRRALRYFDEASHEIRMNSTVLMRAADAATSERDLRRLEDVYADLLANGALSNASRAAFHAHASAQFEIAGSISGALSNAQRAYDIGKDPSALERVYQLAAKAGLRQVALHAALSLCHVLYRGATYCRLSER